MTAPLTDWDAPELNEAAMTKPIDVDAPPEEQRRQIADAADNEANNDADSESEEGEMDFDRWKQRLKKPMMTMRADEEQAKRRCVDLEFFS